MKKKLCFLLGAILLMNSIAFKVSIADDYNEGAYIPGSIAVYNNNISPEKVPVVSAGAAIVIDMDSGRVLYEKNANTKRAIASTTKIMTAIVAIENGNLDDIVKVSKRAAGTLGSSINLNEGEELTLKELLYGLMLNSGNDAAVAIAEHIGGSVEDFSDMMNEKARELGLENTHFITPHGLDKVDHYSTAYDLALITRYALANPVFSSIVKTKSITIQGRQLYNTNEMLSIYQGADGVKTGYTGQAGRCLVTSSTRDNWRIISVVLGCSTRSQRAGSSQTMLDYAYKAYKTYDLLKAGDKIKDISIIKGIKKQTQVLAVSDITYPLKEDEVAQVNSEYDLPERIKAPVTIGMEIGEVKYLLNGRVIGTSKLKVAESIRKKGFLDYLGDTFISWERLIR